MKKNLLFISILALIITFSIETLLAGANPGDFLAYWSSANLFVHGKNPYDQAAMISLEQSITHAQAIQPEQLINAWNPPWLMLILSPLGLLSFRSAHFIWTFINALLIGLVMIISWQLATNNQTAKGILAGFVAGYFFAVTVAYLVIGQVTVLVVLGMLLAILLVNKGSDRLAGAVLILTIIKPHIAYLFLLVLMVWVIKNRHWKIIQGFLIAILSSLVIFWIVDPSWVTDYIALIDKLPYTLTYTSTLGSFMASKFNINIFYFSSILLLFFIKPLLKVQEKNGWLTTMNISLLISLPLAPYGFMFDQIVLLPAIVQIIAWVWNIGLPRKVIVLTLGLIALVYLLVVYMLSIPVLEYYWFFVIPFILLFIYFIPWTLSNRRLNSPISTSLNTGEV